MKSKQIGLTEYNDAILSVYGANPVAALRGTKTTAPDLKKDPKKESKPKAGTLVKETLRLRNTAVLNLKLAKKIQKYEKERLSRLKSLLDKDETSEQKGNNSQEKREEEELSKKNSPWFKNLLNKLRNLVKKTLKKLYKKLVPKSVRSRLRLLRRRINAFKRRVNVNIKRQWRNFTKPLRQARRFIAPIKRNIGVRFRRAQRNLTRPFRQAKRFAETVVKNPKKALLQTQQALTKAKDAVTFGATKVRQFAEPGVRAGREFVGQKVNQGKKIVSEGWDTARSVYNFSREMISQASGKPPVPGGGNRFGFLNRFSGIGQKLNKARMGVMGGIQSAVKGGQQIGEAIASRWSKWKAVLTDPQTYAKIKEGANAAFNKLKGAAQKLYDDFITWLAGTKWFREAIESRIGRKVTEILIKKGGKLALKKILTRLVVGLGTVLSLWEMVERWSKGDYEGAALSALGAIPFIGLVAVVVDILRELFPESWESIVSQMTGKTKEERNEGIKETYDATVKGYQDYGTGINDAGFGAGFAAAAEGMETGNTPQMVIVGDGGEEEFIVPKSKLAYFLGSDTALEFLNFGSGQLISSVQEYLDKTGIGSKAKASIRELSEVKDLPVQKGNNIRGIQPVGSKIGDIVNKVIKFLTEGFESILEPIKKIFDWIKKNVLENPLVRGAMGLAEGVTNFFLGGPAQAASGPPAAVDPYTGSISGDTFMPLASADAAGGRTSAQSFGDTAARGGRKHLGIDITEHSRADSRAPVVAYKTGTVTVAQASNVYPYGEVMVDHGNGLSTRYLHITPSSNVRVGKKVYGGQEVGKLYKYYSSSGGEQTHLHFEVYQDGKIVDPTSYVRNAKNKLSAPLTAARAQAQHTAASTPATPINKDTTVGEDPNVAAEEGMFMDFLSRKASQPSQSAPQLIPMPIPFGGLSLASGRTHSPAWGHASVIGN
jgi:murein DD-endopeptidase MepM/ murein hydrolase activator NlpD